MHKEATTTTTTRPLHTIAREIQRDWTKPNFAAVQYLQAMRALDSISDKYYFDSVESVVRYFLANTVQSRGDKAREIKAELKAMRALSDISDKYYYDSAGSVVRYFLANAAQWSGPVAREIKAELKAMLAR